MSLCAARTLCKQVQWHARLREKERERKKQREGESAREREKEEREGENEREKERKRDLRRLQESPSAAVRTDCNRLQQTATDCNLRRSVESLSAAALMECNCSSRTATRVSCSFNCSRSVWSDEVCSRLSANT